MTELTNDHDLLIQISTKLDVALTRLDAQDGKITQHDTRIASLENWRAGVTGAGSATGVGVEQAWKIATFALGVLTIGVMVYAALKR